MGRSDHATFGVTLIGSIALLFVVGAVATPPDPASQFSMLAVGLPVAIVVSYLLAYRDGYDRLRTFVRADVE